MDRGPRFPTMEARPDICFWRGESDCEVGHSHPVVQGRQRMGRSEDSLEASKTTVINRKGEVDRLRLPGLAS